MLSSSSSRLFSLLTISALIFITGCGGTSSAPNIPLEKVSGNVTFEGKPLTDATIVFSPQTPGLKTSTAKTDSSGNFSLTTVNPGDGAMKGDYKVIVVKQPEVEVVKPADPNDPNYGKSTPYPGADNKPKSLVPEKYATPEKTDLTATVKEGENKFNFELK